MRAIRIGAALMVSLALLALGVTMATAAGDPINLRGWDVRSSAATIEDTYSHPSKWRPSYTGTGNVYAQGVYQSGGYVPGQLWGTRATIGLAEPYTYAGAPHRIHFGVRLVVHPQTLGPFPPIGGWGQSPGGVIRVQGEVLCTAPDNSKQITVKGEIVRSEFASYGDRVYPGFTTFVRGSVACPAESPMPRTVAVDGFTWDHVQNDALTPRRFFRATAEALDGLVTPRLDPATCSDLFGLPRGEYPPPHQTVMYEGRLQSALELGCTIGDFDPDDDSGWEVDFETVCAGAPEATWTNGEWVGPWVGHYARCLFQPLRGFHTDETTVVLQTGPYGDLVAGVTSVAEEFTASGTCGVVGSAEIGGSTLTVDTCKGAASWAPIKVLLGLSVMIGAGVVGFDRIIFALTGKSLGLWGDKSEDKE